MQIGAILTRTLGARFRDNSTPGQSYLSLAAPSSSVRHLYQDLPLNTDCTIKMVPVELTENIYTSHKFQAMLHHQNRQKIP